MSTKIIILSAVLLLGCARTRPKPEIISSKVTVSTSGRDVTDFNNQYIFRAVITRNEISRLSKFEGVKDSYDQFGRVIGLQLTADLPLLALREGDILTAIGKKVLRLGDRMDILTSQISTNESSITFLRMGRPYKTLIQVR